MKWFENLSTMTKMMSAFAVVSATLLAVGIVGITALGTMDHQIDVIVDMHMKGLSAIQTVETNTVRVGKAVRQTIINHDAEGQRKQGEAIETAIADVQSGLDAFEKTLVTAEEKAKLKQVRETLPYWESVNRKAYQAACVGHDADAVGILAASQATANTMFDNISDLRKLKLQVADKANDDATAHYKSSRSLLVAMVLFGLLFAIGVGVAISRAIAGPLQTAVEVLAVVAEGDFTRRLELDRKDEVGQLAASLNSAVGSMRGALSSVAESAGAVTSASAELSAASQSISSGAQEQASSLEETAASLEEMTVAVKQNADNAQQAAQLAQGAREVAEKGGRVVGEAVEAMREINASSRKIADIITAIDEIAFQTNLLALNAAVEAARAGEQGRGFAVVAGEVRNLAQRSASAAKEIKGLINDSVEKVEQGSRLVDQSGVTLAEIVTSVMRVTDIVTEIAASSREQATGIEQVNTAVTQMDSVTQSNASQTEELAGTAEGLTGQAQVLMSLVDKFKLGDNGGAVIHAAPAARGRSRILPLPKPGVSARRKSGSRVPIAATSIRTGTDGFEEF